MDKSLKNKAIDFKGKPYVQVSDRVLFFNEQYPQGAIITEKTADIENYVEFKATAIPDTTNPERKFTGHSQATWGEGFVNSTAALENAETSAVGRALAFMGIGIIESIASADEMTKATTSPKKAPQATEKQKALIAKLMDEKGLTIEIMANDGIIAGQTPPSEVIDYLMNFQTPILTKQEMDRIVEAES